MASPETFVLVGQSNASGVETDPDWNNYALAGYGYPVNINLEGVDYPTNLPNHVNTDNGPVPYLIKYARQAGASEVNIVRYAISGQNIVAVTNQFGNVVSTLKAKGWTPEYWIYVQGEAETLDPTQSPYAKYQEKLEHYIELVLTTFPECRFMVVTLAMNDFDDYGGVGQSAAGRVVVEAAQRAMEPKYPGRVLTVDSRSPSKLAMSSDQVHAKVGNGFGFDVMMQRARERWAILDVDEVDPSVAAGPSTVTLHDDFNWLGTLHVAPGADADTLALAAEVERVFLAMTGDAITRDTTPTTAGVLLGTFDDWEASNFGFASLALVPPYVLEQGHQYVIATDGSRLLILGEDAQAAAHAFWKFMGYLGYYSLLPTDIWEVIPSKTRITVRISQGVTPALAFINAMGNSGGVYDDGQDRLDDWNRRNLVPTGGYGFAHAWQTIIADNQAEFDAHPEYVGSVKKLCVFEPVVRQIALEWAQQEILDAPNKLVQQLAASDSSLGWDAVCSGTNEQSLYTPSDRQISLANYVQSALDTGGTPGRLSHLVLGQPRYETTAEDAYNFAVSVSGSDPALAAKWFEIASHPAPLWLATDYGAAHGASGVATVMSYCESLGLCPQFVMYSIVGRDSGSFSSGGASTSAAYRTFVDQVGVAIGDGVAIIIIEPDALPKCYAVAGGISGTLGMARRADVEYACEQLRILCPNAYIYINVGNSNFRSAAEMCVLISPMIDSCDGISLNVAQTLPTDDEYDYFLEMQAIDSRVEHCIIDTGRNANGEVPGTGTYPTDRFNVKYINPYPYGLIVSRPTEGVVVGAFPSVTFDASNRPGLDGVFWTKFPGGSDGPNPAPGQQPELVAVAAPSAGAFYEPYWRKAWDARSLFDFSEWDEAGSGGSIYRGVRLSILAYGATSVPPTEPINPRILVGVTDGYIQLGQTWEEVSAAYQDAGAVDIVPYAYSAVWTFNLAKPGNGRAALPDKYAIDMARAHASPGTVKGLISEGAPGWGLWGLGYWSMARMGHDPLQTDTASLRSEFLSAAFGTISGIMEDLFDILQTVVPLSSDMLHRMYQILQDALDTSPSAGPENRVYDLAIYVRYLELLLIWTEGDTINQFDDMIRWMWRARSHDLVPVKLSYTQPASWQPLFTELETLYPGFVFTSASAKPWADKDTAITHAELDTIITNGIANNALLPFTPIGFSEDLVYVEHPPDARPVGSFAYSNRNHSILLWIRPDQSGWTVTHRSGFADDADGVAYLRVTDLATSEVAATVTCAIDVQNTEFVPLEGGKMYRVEIDANSGVRYQSSGVAWSKICDLQPSMYQGDWSGYFYVPVGTTEIGGYSNGGTEFRDPAGTLVYTKVGSGYFTFPITPPVTPEIWRLTGVNSKFLLMTVPPAIAMRPSELLIPAELA